MVRSMTPAKVVEKSLTGSKKSDSTDNGLPPRSLVIDTKNNNNNKRNSGISLDPMIPLSPLSPQTSSPLPYQYSPQNTIDLVDAAPSPILGFSESTSSVSKKNQFPMQGTPQGGAKNLFSIRKSSQDFMQTERKQSQEISPEKQKDSQIEKQQEKQQDKQQARSVDKPLERQQDRLQDKQQGSLERKSLQESTQSEDSFDDSRGSSFAFAKPKKIEQPIDVPFNVQLLLQRIEDKIKYGPMNNEKFRGLITQLIEKATTLEKPNLLGAMIEDSLDLSKILEFDVDEGCEIETYWKFHPIFSKIEWLRKYLEKHYQFGKVGSLINPLLYKTCLETIFKLLEVQTKTPTIHSEENNDLTIKLQFLNDKGMDLIKFGESAAELLPALINDYGKLFTHFINKFKREMELVDEKRRVEMFGNFKRQLEREAEWFTKQPQPSYEAYQTLSIMQKISAEIQLKQDQDTDIIYASPKLLFRGNEKAPECKDAWFFNQTFYIDQRKSSYAKDIKMLGEQIRSITPTVPSFIFPAKNRINTKTRSRIVLPKGKETAILILPDLDFLIDPVFLQLDDKGYAQIVYYYDINPQVPLPVLNIEIYLKLNQEQQYKIYHFSRAMQFALDQYTPLFHIWFDGRVAGPEDILTLKYSASKMQKKQLETISLVPLPLNTYKDYEFFNLRYPAQASYIPLRSIYFEKLDIVPQRNFDKTKRQAMDYHKRYMQKEWEKCCSTICAKILDKSEDVNSISYLMNSLNAAYSIIEALCTFCYGHLFWQHKAFKFLHDSNFHRRFSLFSEFIKKEGIEGSTLKSLEQIVQNLKLGADALVAMKLKPTIPYINGALEHLQEDCIEAFKMRASENRGTEFRTFGMNAPEIRASGKSPLSEKGPVIKFEIAKSISTSKLEQGEVRENNGVNGMNGVNDESGVNNVSGAIHWERRLKKVEEEIQQLKIQHIHEMQVIQKQFSALNESQLAFQNDVRSMLQQLLVNNAKSAQGNSNNTTSMDNAKP